jgi:hypothetical protein
MITRKNNKNRTAFVYDVSAGLETFISQSFKNAKQGNRLTIRDGDVRIDLNGRQISTLKKVLATSSRLAASA